MDPHRQVAFRKMNGLGNDFVVIDARAHPFAISQATARAIAARDTGIGCDQVIVMAPSRVADVRMRIWNAAGGEVESCGNASRCVADIVLQESGREAVTIETLGGVLSCWRAGADAISVDMGRPRFAWQDIPLAEEFRDTRGIELQIGPIDAPVLHTPSVVNVGNPHAIFWVDDVTAYDLARFGPLLENHPLFPEGANISLAQVVSPSAVTVRVWERGAGLTRACGTAACAVAVAAARKNLAGRTVEVTLPGGTLRIDWRQDDHIVMSGPFAYEFEGVLPGDIVAEAVS